jgi:hypothetical protein
MAQTQELNVVEKERDLLIKCVADAYEALRVLGGVDENGPALVWLADQLLQAHRRSEKTS